MPESPDINLTLAASPIIEVAPDGGVTIDVSMSAGSGDVVGPASATDNAIARFNGTTGKLIQNSGITIADGATGTLSGTNSGDVTLGTANGLSLTGQALSLGLSSSSTTGALSSADWSIFNGKQASGSYITALTGDVTASGPGSAAATLANTAVTPGSYTLASITVDSKGRVTAASTGTATTPGGSNTQVQFNDGGSFGGDTNFTFNKTTDTVQVPNVAAISSAGLSLQASNSTVVGLLGAANTANVEWYGAHNFSAATQDTIAAFTGAGKTLGSLATATYPSLTELSYVKGVTSAIQTQLNGKQATLTLGTNVATSLANNMAASGTLAILGANTFTGVQTLPAGTVAAPSLNLGDSGTGIYRSAANEVAIGVSGAQHLRVASGGVTTSSILTVGAGVIRDFGSGQLSLGSGNHYATANGFFATTLLRVSSSGLGSGNKIQLRVLADNVGIFDNTTLAAQAVYVANTYTSATSYEAAGIRWSSNVAIFGPVKGSGGGSSRNAAYHTTETGVNWSSGSGSPESVVTAPVGSLYTRTDGGASTTLYVKESGIGNTGWIAK